MKTLKQCIGFGELEGKCRKPVDKKTSVAWCKTCEQTRRKHITQQLENLSKNSNKTEHEICHEAPV